LSYKPNIDDFRESPSFTFIDILKENNISYASFDPWANTKVEPCQLLDFEEFLSEIDILVIYVAHTHIKDIKGKMTLLNIPIFEAMKV